MDITLTEEHLSIQHAAYTFAQQYCLPDVIERDDKQQFAYNAILHLAKLGFMGMMINEQYGGSHLDTISYVLAVSEISKIDASVAVCMSVNNSLVCYGLQKYGSEEQKKVYLTPLANGHKNNQLYIGSFLLSEPEVGSDATSVKTTAKDMGDYYLLNGVKCWITNASVASVYIVIAQNDTTKQKNGSLVLIVEKHWTGVVLGAKENKLGIRSSDTHTVSFNNVKVPKKNRIGEEGFGFKFALYVISSGRIGIAAQAYGIAMGAYELSKKYAKERKTFDKPIAQHQIIQFKLADMATRIEATKLLCLKTAWEKDQHLPFMQSSSIAKVYASETAMYVSTEAVQIHGGFGYVKEYHVERLMRDAKITQIYEGTSEIQRIVIGRSILK